MKRTPGPWPIREVSGHCLQVTIGQQPISFINHADARLIAAAPELLEACKAAVHSLKSYEYGNASPDVAIEAVKFIEDIVAKVEEEP